MRNWFQAFALKWVSLYRSTHRLRAVRKHFNHWCEVTEQAIGMRKLNKDNAEKAARFDRLDKVGGLCTS